MTAWPDCCRGYFCSRWRLCHCRRKSTGRARCPGLAPIHWIETMQNEGARSLRNRARFVTERMRMVAQKGRI